MAKIPTFERYMNPLLAALRQLGGSASIHELYERVTTDMALTDEQLDVMHDPDHGNVTEVAYRMAWARTYLKKVGLIDTAPAAFGPLPPRGNVSTT